MTKKTKTPPNSVALKVLEYGSLAVAGACFLYLLVPTIFAGSLGPLLFFIMILSPVGWVGAAAVIVWAISKSLQAGAKDRRAFFSFGNSNAPTKVILVGLALLLVALLSSFTFPDLSGLVDAYE